MTEPTDQQTEESHRRYGYAPVVHAVFLCLCLAVAWICLSGYFTPLLLGLGLASIALSVFIAMRMDVIDHEGVPMQMGLRVVAYWGWLLKEIYKANIDVARRVIQPELDISPSLFRTPTTQKTELGHTVFANSITLTPGTVSIVLEEDYVVVHALSQGAADDLSEGEMDRRVSAVER